MLDTWFSSALWPFATLGWPERDARPRLLLPGRPADDRARDHPPLGEPDDLLRPRAPRRDSVPRRDHPLDGARARRAADVEVARHRDRPARVIAQATARTRHGTGCSRTRSTQDVRFSYSAIEEGGKLANKLWNAARLILQTGARPGEPRPASVEERWILARLSQAQRAYEGHLAAYDLAHAVDELYHVTFDDFCDWYLEAVKQRLYEGDDASRTTAVHALERLLKLLHPVMPHVTEEIWSHLPDRSSRLIVAPWPEAGDASDARALERVQEAATIFRRSGVLPRARRRRAPDLRRRRQARARRSPGTATSSGARAAGKEIDALREATRERRASSSARRRPSRPEREKLERYRRELDAISE